MEGRFIFFTTHLAGTNLENIPMFLAEFVANPSFINFQMNFFTFGGTFKRHTPFHGGLSPDGSELDPS